ncbi:hypothetical protein EGW08_013125 [Elysia chlorotica]|uniref:Glutamate receptor n=1 Tax=Elysia chlorotica TaxID=188477 RepID=A0A3S1HGW7_ELYCH|nr:hypothetical protein EGW08_013125 [Elysia chlorotica]
MMAILRSKRVDTAAGLWVVFLVVSHLVMGIMSLTASDISVGGLPGFSSANQLVLFPNYPLTTESPYQDIIPTVEFERPIYTIGTIHPSDGGDSGPSPVTQQTIIEQAGDGNVSFSRVALQDFGSQDVSAFKQAVQSLKQDRPDAVVGHYSWAYAAATEHMRIPYFVTSLTPRDQPESPYLIQLFPSGAAFAQASEDTLNYYELNKVAIFHDTEIGQVVLERLAQRTQIEVTGFFVTKKTQAKIRDHLKMIRSQYFNTIVAVLNPEHVKLLLDQGLSEYGLHSYVDSRANITVLRLMMDFNSEACTLGQADLSLEAAVFHDAVQLSAAFVAMKEARTPNQRRLGMRRAVKNLKLDGCTGLLEFSKFGLRSENFLQVMTLQGYLSGASGTWRSGPAKLTQRMEPFRSYSVISQIGANIFPDRPLRITIINEPPFVQKKTDRSIDTGHPVYEGFCIDILMEMSKLLGFKFNISEVPDGKFGSKKPLPRGWTGMIRQLIDNKADVALAPFQMSTERAEVVDFTKPFMTKGTTVVVKRPDHKIGMFQFLSPFSHVVWSAIFVAFVGTSLMLFGVSRVNSDQHAKYAHNLRESFWYIWGTLLRGSLTGSPHAISSRIVSSAWWFFALIISSIYTANLAAFLTITISDVGINTAADLALQVGGGRVREGKYAFIWDSPTIRHTISNDCDLMEIGSPFDLKGYGFAYQKDARYGDKLSWALLKMQDDGVLYRLERKWWRPQICPNQKQSAKTKSLDLETVAGMYVVILSGALLSLSICFLQFMFARFKKKRFMFARFKKKRVRPITFVRCLAIHLLPAVHVRQVQEEAGSRRSGYVPLHLLDALRFTCFLQFMFARFKKKRKLQRQENGQRRDSDAQLPPGEDAMPTAYTGNKPAGPDNEITYANHSQPYYRDPDDWKLKYDSY